jgi:DNA-binding phage protein
VPTHNKTAFERYVDEKKKSPMFAAEYERVGAEIHAVDDLIRTVDDARLALGMTKAALARKISTTPEAMRRLLTSSEANPTLTTILGVLEALDLRLAVLKAHADSSKSATKKPTSISSKFMAAKSAPKRSAFIEAQQFFKTKPAAASKKPQHRKTA